MAAIPVFQEAHIEGRVGRRSFRRGRDYVQSGAIFNARRQGSTLKAFCTGSSVAAYRVQVTFDRRGVAEADCSCPVGRGGYCKHVAALLLAWRQRPEDFVEVEELDSGLARCSRRELTDLIKDLLDLHGGEIRSAFFSISSDIYSHFPIFTLQGHRTLGIFKIHYRMDRDHFPFPVLQVNVH